MTTYSKGPGPASTTQGNEPALGDNANPNVTAQRLVYFAAERTLLSWIRVALGLMALGFVVDRFELVLKSVRSTPGGAFYATGGFAWLGATLVGLGIATTVVASVRYVRFHIGYHRKHTTDPGRGLPWAVALAVSVAIVGTAIAVLLAVPRG